MSDQDRRHPATAAQLRAARRRGEAPISHELAAAAALSASLLALVLWGQPVWQACQDLAVRQLQQAANQEPLNTSAALAPLLAALAPLLISFVVIGVAATAGQTGFLLAPLRLRPDWRRLLRGPGQPHWAADAALAMLRGLIALTVAVWTAFRCLPRLAAYGSSLPQMMRWNGEVLGNCVGALGVTLLALGAVDYLWRRLQHRSRLQMTDEQLRQATRDQSPAPEIVRRRRQIGAHDQSN